MFVTLIKVSMETQEGLRERKKRIRPLPELDSTFPCPWGHLCFMFFFVCLFLSLLHVSASLSEELFSHCRFKDHYQITAELAQAGMFVCVCVHSCAEFTDMATGVGGRGWWGWVGDGFPNHDVNKQSPPVPCANCSSTPAQHIQRNFPGFMGFHVVIMKIIPANSIMKMASWRQLAKFPACL